MAGESSWGEGGEREDRQDGGDPRGRREPGNVSGDVVGAAVPDGGDRGGVWGDAGGGASGGGATRVPGTSAQRVVVCAVSAVDLSGWGGGASGAGRWGGGAGGGWGWGRGGVWESRRVDEREVVERGHIYRMAPPWKLPMDDETNATVAAAWAAGVPMEEMGKWWGVGIHTIAKRVRRLKLRGRKVVRERSAANLAQDARMRAWTGRRKEA